MHYPKFLKLIRYTTKVREGRFCWLPRRVRKPEGLLPFLYAVDFFRAVTTLISQGQRSFTERFCWLPRRVRKPEGLLPFLCAVDLSCAVTVLISQGQRSLTERFCWLPNANTPRFCVFFYFANRCLAKMQQGSH
jgi:hypothetical protein